MSLFFLLFFASYVTIFVFQIIVRPATVFGAEDRFLNWIADASKLFRFFPLLHDGAALVQPIYCNDVAKALMAIIFVSDN